MNKLIFFTYTALVTFISVRPMTSASIGNWDKAAHFTIYAIFAVLAAKVVKSDRQLLYLCTVIVIYSGILELVQSQLPGRFMSAYDLAANILGVAIGAALSRKFINASHT